MTKLSFTTVVDSFKQAYPNGSITKLSRNKYEVCFDTRDLRSEAEKELDIWGISKDTRKFYNYSASNLTQLAQKLKLNIVPNYQMSKANMEFEELIRQYEEDDFNLFEE